MFLNINNSENCRINFSIDLTGLKALKTTATLLFKYAIKHAVHFSLKTNAL